jgi:hypothetical protein
LWIAEVLRSHYIEPVNLTDGVLLQLRQFSRLWNEASANVSHGSSRRRDESGRINALIAAVGSKQAGPDACELKERL